jgi:hypothetical protein
MAAEIARPISGVWSWRAVEILKRVFSFPAMLGVALVVPVFYQARNFLVDPDLWWHLKVGEAILATHHWPTTDPYSFTVHGQPWVAYEWLGEVVTAWVSHVGGLRGLDFSLIAMGSAIIIALYFLATMGSNSKAGFLSAGLLCPLTWASLSLRPQMLGYLFLIVTLIVLELFRQGKKRAIWILPPLLLIWVNAHGFWIIGLGTIFVYWVCGLAEFRIGGIEAKRWGVRERKQISLAFLLSLIAVSITPYGTELAVFPFKYALSLPLNSAYIQEWQPMPFNIAIGKFFLVLMLGIFLAQMALGLVWRLEEVLLFAGGTAMACLHARFILLFVPFSAPLLARIFARWVEPYNRAIDKYVLNGIVMAIVATVMIHYFPSRADLEKRVAEKSPLKAVAYLRQHPVPGPMFNSYVFGGYLVWALGPEQKVFIDGRGDIYERGGVISDYMQVTDLRPGGLDVLRRYQIQSCLLQRDEPLSTVLAAMPDWQKVYSDSTSALFVRRKVVSALGFPANGS